MTVRLVSYDVARSVSLISSLFEASVDNTLSRPGRFGWRTLIEYDDFPLGLNEDVVRAISAKKDEPEWLLDFRLRAYRRWLTMKEPAWSDNRCLC